jgi:hypothetical protein
MSRAASAVLSAITHYGPELFRIFPKGCGLACTAPGGIKAHELVTYYSGELYPPWLWAEKQVHTHSTDSTQRKSNGKELVLLAL